MRIGIDLGSRTIKVAAIVDGVLQSYQVEESSFDPHQQAIKMINGYTFDKIIATGYGRHLAHKHFAQAVITEIKAHALGARYFYPDCMTILDVGGQDCKVISLNESGKVSNFQMNDLDISYKPTRKMKHAGTGAAWAPRCRSSRSWI